MKVLKFLGYKVIAIAITSCLCLLSCSEESSDQTPLDVNSTKYVPAPIVQC
jgi:hypothetical protein